MWEGPGSLMEEERGERGRARAGLGRLAGIARSYRRLKCKKRPSRGDGVLDRAPVCRHVPARHKPPCRRIWASVDGGTFPVGHALFLGDHDGAGSEMTRHASVRVVNKAVTRTVLNIMGMRDNACRERISEALAAIDGVEEVDINLHRARARILHTPPCRPADLLSAIVEAGYGASLLQ